MDYSETDIFLIKLILNKFLKIGDISNIICIYIDKADFIKELECYEEVLNELLYYNCECNCRDDFCLNKLSKNQFMNYKMGLYYKHLIGLKNTYINYNI